MGGSLRRHKRHRPKIIKRKAKKPFRASKLPVELAAARPGMAAKLGRPVDWEQGAKVEQNYARLGFVADPNAGHGRNARADPIAAAKDDAAVDDDARAALGEARSTGAVPPRRLTPRQRATVEAVLAAHGEDLDAAVLDRRANPAQMARGELARLVAAYRYWPAGSGVEFRVPTKRLATFAT